MASRFDLKCFKPTTDWWCGNYEGNTVKVSLLMCDPRGTYWKLCVSGNDDCAMAKLFENNYEEALELFLTFMRASDITFEFCKKHGLTSD